MVAEGSGESGDKRESDSLENFCGAVDPEIESETAVHKSFRIASCASSSIWLPIFYTR